MKNQKVSLNQEKVIDTGKRIQKEKSVFDLNKSLSVPELTSEEKNNYLERMIARNKDKNLMLVLQKEKQTPFGKWEKPEPGSEIPVHALPVARESKRARKEEASAIKQAKKVFIHADECTAREITALNNYFKTFKDGKDPEIKGNDEPYDPALTSYVNELLLFELSDKHLTDAYLADHIGEMLEYKRRLSEYKNLRQKYPKFFESLAEEKIMLLEEKASVADDLSVLLNQHLRLHGLSVKVSDRGPAISIIRDQNRDIAQRNSKIEEYNTEHKNFYKKNILNLAIISAGQYTMTPAYKSENALADISEKMSGNREELDKYAVQIDSALLEVKKALLVRDELISNQKKELELYRALSLGEEKRFCENRIKANNARIRVATSHIDHYREYLMFASGNIQDMSEDAKEFLVSENKQDLVRMINRKLNASNMRQTTLDSAEGFVKEIKDGKGDVAESKQMQDFVMHMSNLLNFLGQKMPPLSFGKEAVDAGCIMAAALYNNAIKSIKTCLSDPITYKNNKDAEHQLKSTLQLCSQESEFFRQRVFEYLDFLNSSEQKEKKGIVGLTWYDALSYERAVVLNLDEEDGVELEKLGDAASEVYKLTQQKDGKENTVFFRKAESTAVIENSEVVRAYKESLGNNEDLMEFFDALEIDAKKATYKDFVELFIKICDANSMDAYKIFMEKGWESSKKIERLRPREAQYFGQQLKYFSRLIAQRNIGMNAGISPGRNLSDRNVATSRLSQLFGISNIISDSRTCFVKNEDSLVKGNLMEDAKGTTYYELAERCQDENIKVVYSKEAISQLFTMQMFDLICGQIDRHYNNFRVQTKEKDGKVVITGIIGIDNDMSFGRLKFKHLKDGKYAYTKKVSPEHLKGLPIQFINTIMNLKREVVDYVLGDIINKEESDTLWDRITGLQDSIARLDDIKNTKEDRTGRWYFEGEDGDDTLRQLKQLAKMKEETSKATKQEEKLPNVSLFGPQFCSDEDMAELEQERRRELEKKKQK